VIGQFFFLRLIAIARRPEKGIVLSELHPFPVLRVVAGEVATACAGS